MTTIEELKQVAVYTCSPNDKALIEKAAAELEALTKELNNIDAVLARRPALADCKTRTDKIEMAISTASKVDDLSHDLKHIREPLISNIETLTASLAEVTRERDELKQGYNNIVASATETQSRLTTLETANKVMREAILNALTANSVHSTREHIREILTKAKDNWEQALTTPTPNPIEQELKELRRDKEIVDFLEANNISLEVNAEWENKVELEVIEDEAFCHSFKGVTLRQAVRKALDDSASKERTA